MKSFIEVWKEKPFTLIGDGTATCRICGKTIEPIGSFLTSICEDCVENELIYCKKPIKNPQ
ncbi:MAG: hypothetical protein Q8M06_10315, partial [Methanobacteriaceae archaeon]|nr:hypothetical protein [Methanobacteriaceae archaeon]